MSLGLLGARLWSAEDGPDLARFTPIPAFPALAAFANTHQIPLGPIQPPDETRHLRPGDSITALVTLCEKGGRHTQWLLYLRAVAPRVKDQPAKAAPPLVIYSYSGARLEFVSEPIPVSLRTVGPFVETSPKRKAPKLEDNEARLVLDEGFLGLGLDQAAAAFLRITRSKAHGSFWFSTTPPSETQVAEGRKKSAPLQITASEEHALAGGVPAMESYFTVVQQTHGLEKILLKVVEMPSIWSILFHAGVRVDLDPVPQRFALADSATWELPTHPPAYYFPLELKLNDRPAMKVTFVVTAPRSPLLACGGILGFLAERYSDKQTYLTLWVISARRAQ